MMSLDEVFWQDILDHPNDDVPRLVYADWLEEQANPEAAARGGFMHAQCLLARLPAEDPNRAALEKRARALLAEHEQAWSLPLLRRCQVDRWCFHRGAVEEVEMREPPFLEHAEELFRQLPLRRLHLTDVHQPAQLALYPQLSRIEALDLRYSRLTDAGVRALLTSPFLTSLRELDLTGTALEAAGVEAVLTALTLPRMCKLHLSRNRLGGCIWPALFASSRQTELIELSLAQAEIEADELLRAAPLLPPLQALNLSDNLFYPQQELLGALLACARLAGLRTLHLRHTGIPERHLRFLAAALPKELTELSLGENVFGDGGARVLAAATGLAGLTHLDLHRAAIGEEGARALAESPYLSRLTRLDLRDNRISSEAGQRLRARFGNALLV
jgi:uncharacterized protein (TIGR02996 family)